MMRTFRFLIWSRRHAVPAEAQVTVRDAERAIEMARQRLRASPDYLAIDVQDGERLAIRIARDDGAELGN
jgi:hypothetical protein